MLATRSPSMTSRPGKWICMPPCSSRLSAPAVTPFHRGTRVASHLRSYTAYAATTIHQHRPRSHQAHLEWTPSRLIHWAATVGPATAEVVRTILERKVHPEGGLSRLPRNSQPCQSLYRNPPGSSQPTGVAAAGLF